MSIDRHTVWLAMQLFVGTLVGIWIFNDMQEPDIGSTAVNAAIISEYLGLAAAFLATKAICGVVDAFRWLFLRDR